MDTKQTPTDEELMEAYAADDFDACRVLYERHAPRVLGYLTQKLGTRPLAEEVFQESFLRLHRARAAYRRGEPFLPWLFTVAHSCAVDALRKRRPEYPVGDAPLPERVAVPPPETELPLERLAPADRESLRLRFDEDLDFDEIARRLSVSEAGARQRVSRALRRLRDLVGGESGQGGSP